MFKYLLLNILSITLLTTQAAAADNWSWAEIPYDKATTHIIADEQDIWVAGSGGGVYRFDSNDNTYQHYTRVNDGFADNYIYDMTIDSAKNLWLATVHGLSVFKNDTWHTFTTENTPILKSDFITAVAADPIHDILWVGTYDTGLYRYDIKADRWKHYQIPELSANYAFVTSLAIGPEGDVWLGVWGEGAYHLANGIWKRYDPGNSGLLSYFVYVKALEKDGTVWFWCNNDFAVESTGLVAFQPTTELWKVYLPGHAIHSLQVDDKGVVWAQSPNFLYKKERQQFISVKSITSNMDHSFPNHKLLTNDGRGSLLVGSSHGFSEKKVGSDDWVNHIPPALWDMQINDLLVDELNNKWIATRAGLHQVAPDNTIKVYSTYGENSHLPSAQINALAKDNQGNVWIATDGGLVTYNGKDWHVFTHENSGLVSNAVHGVNVDHKGAIWVSFSIYAAGVQSYDGNSWQQFTKEDGLTSNSISGIYSADKEVWLQSAQGVSIYKNNKWHKLTEAEGLLSNNVTSLALMPDHAWIGTDAGLVKYDGYNFTYIIDELPKKNVSAVYEDPQGNLFIGTLDGGLSLLTNDKLWEHKTWHDGLTNMRITRIVPDAQQRLWLGTQFAVGITQPAL